MAGFGTAEKAIVNASAYSTLMGKYYQWIFVVFRFFLALSMAKSVTGDSEKVRNHKIFENFFEFKS